MTTDLGSNSDSNSNSNSSASIPSNSIDKVHAYSTEIMPPAPMLTLVPIEELSLEPVGDQEILQTISPHEMSPVVFHDSPSDSPSPTFSPLQTPLQSPVGSPAGSPACTPAQSPSSSPEPPKNITLPKSNEGDDKPTDFMAPATEEPIETMTAASSVSTFGPGVSFTKSFYEASGEASGEASVEGSGEASNGDLEPECDMLKAPSGMSYEEALLLSSKNQYILSQQEPEITTIEELVQKSEPNEEGEVEGFLVSDSENEFDTDTMVLREYLQILQMKQSLEQQQMHQIQQQQQQQQQQRRQQQSNVPQNWTTSARIGRYWRIVKGLASLLGSAVWVIATTGLLTAMPLMLELEKEYHFEMMEKEHENRELSAQQMLYPTSPSSDLLQIPESK